jgi:hypothetical protein
MTMPPEFRAAMAIGQHLALDGLALHRDVAVLVGGRAANDGDVDREAWNSSHSRSRIVTTSTRSSVVRAFCLPPVWRGST